ncbi:MAG: lactonase family protein, partial [Clostridia bacterium]|nr:lactonase family protein [Clostridia bacterium]
GKGPDPKRQDKAHAHCAEVTPDGKHLCVADLGIDRTKVYDFQNREKGLIEKPEMAIIAKGGAGPRHIIFHSNGRLAFVIHELDNTLSSFIYDGKAFAHVQTTATIPADFHDFSKASAIKISEDGRMLLASNRGHDSIASFALDPATGKMEHIAICKLAGAFPRDFEFMPGEKFILAGHENSNNIMSYAFDRATGTLTPAHGPHPLFRPVYIKFGAVKKEK